MAPRADCPDNVRRLNALGLAGEAEAMRQRLETTPMSEAVIPNRALLGTCSAFGGVSRLYSREGIAVPDPGMGKTEGLALFELSEVGGAVDPQGVRLFTLDLPAHGLGHNLNAEAAYCAMRWNYQLTPKSALRLARVQVCSLDRDGKPLRCVNCRPVDWGPSDETTRRLIDLSPGALHTLGIDTDAMVQATLILSPA
ncbi:MAG: hypothetical protein IT578_09905 [Verrucomicrobiae bacterium]|nr:hypothetical protein [Verrucomicrobiae bacterium]